MKFISLVGMGLALSACSFVDADRDTEVPEPKAMDAHSHWEQRYLGAHGMELEIKLPPEVAPQTEVHWNDNFGRLEISAPAHNIDFIITGEIESVESRRFDLDAGIFNIEYLDESEAHLFYKASLPDGTLPYFHFFKSIEINGKTYQIQNNPLVEFGQEDVELMLDIASTISSSETAEN